MNYIPIDVNTTQPQSGGMSLPEGWYILQIEDATKLAPTRDGTKQFRQYKSKVLWGPNNTQECAGKPFVDRIQEGDPNWNGRHMELFVAAMGSVDEVRRVAAPHGGRVLPEMLHGRTYIVQLVKKDNYTNAVQRLPYTNENWAASVGNAIAQPASATPSLFFQSAQQVAAPIAQAQLPAIPTVPVIATVPAVPTMPMAAPAPVAIVAPPSFAGMPPLPPPPPGIPAGR